MARKGEPLPLARIELKTQLVREYADLLPPLSAEQWHLIRGRQEIICRHERDRAVQTLPKLLASAEDRTRFLTVLDQLLADPRISTARTTAAQRAMHARLELLPAVAARTKPLAPARKRKVASK